MNKRTLLVVVAVLALTLACTVPSFTSEPTSAPPVQPPVEQPPVEQPPSNVLFQDDFSSTDGPWDVYNTDYKILDYQSGGFRVWLNESQLDVWSEIHTPFPTDVTIEVDATTIGGPEDNDFGVICRYQEDESGDDPLYNFYFFIISSDGYATIARTVANDQAYLTDSGQMEYYSVINTGYATNHIRADCIGSTLSLYVNDQFVMSVQDTSITNGGSAGVIVGTFDEVGVDILFDNFVVKRP